MLASLGMAAAAAGGVVLFAAETPDPLDPTRLLVGAGLGGLIILGRWRKWFYLGPEVAEKDLRITRLEAEVIQLRQAMEAGKDGLIADLKAALDRATARAEGRAP